MAFKAKYKQLLRFSAGSTADGGGGGGGYGGGGATPQNSPRQGPLPSPRGPPSPPDVECKMPRYNGYCNHDDHSSHIGGRTTLYVGSISPDAREQDLEAAFSIYGRVQRVLLHPENYGFVVFYEPQDADAARRRLNCQEFFGSRISVEFAKEHRIPRYDNHHGHDDRYDQYGQQGGNTKLFVGNISRDIQEYHIEGLFSIYGR
ncbi:hypothetical protein PAHAL_3G130900 [Panicum hallii]|uniref:RRM domain-containing protein n=2 Tax=Panicum hallii TaxID=206008 RepID=A0A2T8KI34_9POAL|nr:hypothetical protein PAHAL_3G130900 [Panicum hallii]